LIVPTTDAAIAYSRPVGNREPDDDGSTSVVLSLHASRFTESLVGMKRSADKAEVRRDCVHDDGQNGEAKAFLISAS